MKTTLKAAILPITALLGAAAYLALAADQTDPKSVPAPQQEAIVFKDNKLIVAGGCFWCTEMVFEGLPGVSSVISGYAGGTEASANYDQVSDGRTEHAEVIEITYDPAVTDAGKLLHIFFAVAHDPTQLNKQGPDHGRQYRSAAFYSSPEEKAYIEAYLKQLEGAKTFSTKIATTLEPLTKFYPAEEYHQDYAQRNPRHPYVVQHALPKVTKLKKFLETR